MHLPAQRPKTGIWAPRPSVIRHTLSFFSFFILLPVLAPQAFAKRIYAIRGLPSVVLCGKTASSRRTCVHFYKLAFSNMCSAFWHFDRDGHRCVRSVCTMQHGRYDWRASRWHCIFTNILCWTEIRNSQRPNWNQNHLSLSLSLSLSLHLNSHFPGGPGLAGIRILPFWIFLQQRWRRWW